MVHSSSRPSTSVLFKLRGRATPGPVLSLAMIGRLKRIELSVNGVAACLGPRVRTMSMVNTRAVTGNSCNKSESEVVTCS